MKFNAVALVLMLAVVLAGIVTLPLAAANPDTCTWTNGSADGLWSTAGNWSCGHAPANGDDVVFDATSSTPASVDVLTANLASLTVSSGYLSTITLDADQCSGVLGTPEVCVSPRSTWGTVAVNSVATLNVNAHILHVGSLVMTTGTLDATDVAFSFANIIDDGTWDTAGATFISGSSQVFMTSLTLSNLKSDNPFNSLTLIGDGGGSQTIVPGQQITMQSDISVGDPAGFNGRMLIYEDRTLNTNNHLLKTASSGGSDEIVLFGCVSFGCPPTGPGARVVTSGAKIQTAILEVHDTAALTMDGSVFRNVIMEDIQDIPPVGVILLNQVDFAAGSGATTHFIWHITESQSNHGVTFEFADLGTTQNNQCTTNCYKLYRNDVLVAQAATGSGFAPDSARLTVLGGWGVNDKMEFVSPASAGGPGAGTFGSIGIQFNSCESVTLRDTRPEAANGILWIWNWGDGTQQTTTSVPQASHNYATRDVYTIQVTAQDRSGRIDKFVGPLDLTGPACQVQPIAQIVGPYILGILILVGLVLLIQVAVSRTNKYTRWLLVVLIVATVLVAIFLYFGWTPALPGGIQFTVRDLK